MRDDEKTIAEQIEGISNQFLNACLAIEAARELGCLTVAAGTCGYVLLDSGMDKLAKDNNAAVELEDMELDGETVTFRVAVIGGVEFLEIVE